MTKEQLRRYRDIRRELESIDGALRAIDADMYSLRSVEISDVPKASSRISSNRLDFMLDKKAELLRIYSEKREALRATLLAIEQAIDSLDYRERTVLRMYYIEGLRWEEVCDRTYFSWRTVHRIHSAALAKLKDL